MSKDRYSNNHTFQVVGGTQTVIISENLETIGDIEVGVDLNVLGDTALVDLLVSGTLDVTGMTTVDDISILGNATITGNLSRNAATEIYYTMLAAAFNPVVNWAAAFTHTHASDGSFVRVSTGDDLQAAHSVILPNGCTVTELKVRFDPGAASGFTVSADFKKRNKVSGAITLISNVTATTGTSGVVNLDSTTGINEVIANLTNTYWVVFSITAPGGSTLDLYDVELEYEVTDFE